MGAPSGRAPKISPRERRLFMKAENHVRKTIRSLDSLIQGLHKQLDTDPPKPSISDYVRLVQLRADLGKEQEEERQGPIHVHWVNHETTPEPDPDPNVPWEGDEPLP